MREIKFRGKSYATNAFEYGSLDVRGAEVFILTSDFNGENCSHLVDPDSVGQFTGMYDKQGKELYEGDIVTLDEKKEWNFYGETGVVSYIDYQFAYEIPSKRKADGRRVYCELIMLTPTVIGNVTDNPELLKGDEE